MPKRTFRALDLFAGAGGLTLGLKNAGFEVLAAIDADPLASATYHANHPRTTVLCADIKKISPAKLMKDLNLRAGSLDLLAGCPPCQGFSRIRTLNGAREGDEADAENNDLVLAFLKFALVFQPKAILLENVPGLARDDRLEVLKRRLSTRGYQIAEAVVNASNYGVPQSRNRFVLLAAKKFTPLLAEAKSKSLTVRDALGHLPPPGASGDPLHDYEVNRAPLVRKIIAAVPKDGGSRHDLPDKLVLRCHRKTDGFKDVYGRMKWNSPSPTITGGCINPSKGRFLHPDQDRAITLREAALLQGFPRNYKFDLSRGRYPAAQMIGNAFPPAFATHHALALARGLGGKR